MRGARTAVRFDRGDLRWFVRWPAAVFTGRFPRHEGHFDVAKRIWPGWAEQAGHRLRTSREAGDRDHRPG
jgi:hypothetical protein